MRTLEPPNRLRIGLMGILVVMLLIGVGQSFASVPILFARPSYYGQFIDTSGLNKGDKVRVAGMDVGKVESLKIDSDHVVIKFSIGTNSIGTESRLGIRTDTILGRKVLEIEARGNQPLRPGDSLPLSQSATPYQIYDAFLDVTKAASGWNIDTVKQSLKVLSETIDQTYPHLSVALDGVAKFSDTIVKRDGEIKHLLEQSNQVASVLGDRSTQVDRLLVNTKTLLAAFNERGRAIDALLNNVAAFSAQVQGLINENPNFNHVLEQLHQLSGILVQRKDDLANDLIQVGAFLPSLNEAIGSGPFFKVVLHNLAPYQILQPWVDAAFKKRGINPEDFWRSAGLPEFQFPDPHGNRFPNGAPSPALPVLEGIPEHPGPAVPPGSPCSYTPAHPGDNVTIGDEVLSRPWNPLPCAGATTGPYGGPTFPAPIDVQTSTLNPDGLPPGPPAPPEFKAQLPASFINSGDTGVSSGVTEGSQT
ncbi:mammalian cell entry protein [Mycobacterium uberis]|uniref:Mammalian cell entry protein n=1 Tax=Mycobacterium uberis TaxID=2162698 RepID=A0A3E1HIX7_9MYCO|nr:virulence factor Mce family protein [Mycobacterium uberis]RFD26376.1 mammalian cell entry protein [Mycobacterium uberis]